MAPLDGAVFANPHERVVGQTVEVDRESDFAPKVMPTIDNEDYRGMQEPFGERAHDNFNA